MLATGATAPEFVLPDLTGSEQSLDSLLSGGRPVLLVFFKASCPTCQLTLPYLERYSGKYGLHVIGISQDNAPTTREFAGHFGLNYPMLLDDTERYPVSNAYGLRYVPSMFLVDGERRIIWSSSGFSRPELEELAGLAGFIAFDASDRSPEWKPG